MFRLILNSGEEVTAQPLLIQGIPFFKKHPDLLTEGTYKVKSAVSRTTLDTFFARLGGQQAPMPTELANELRILCEEFEFTGFDGEIRKALGDTQGDLKELVDKHNVLLEQLQRQIAALEKRITDTNAELRSEIRRIDVSRRIREVVDDVQQMKERLSKSMNMANSARDNSTLSEDEASTLDDVVNDVQELKEEVRNMARADAIEELVTEVLRTKEDDEKRVSGLANDVRELKETVTKMASDAEVNVKKDDEERVSGLANDVRELKEEVRNMARADAIEELVTEVLRTKEDDEKRVSSL